MGEHAKQLLGQADQEIADLKQQVATLQQQQKDKSADIAVKDYAAETDRLKVVGGIDPTSLQIIVRGLVEDILGTQLAPVLHGHAELQGELAGKMQPPPQ